MAKTRAAPTLVEILDYLHDCIAEIHWRWEICLAVFGRPGTRVQVLNRRTGRIFACFQAALIDSIVLEIAKLFDPPVMGRPPNEKHPWSLKRAWRDLALPDDDPRRERIERQLNEAEAICAPIIRRRHARIAHHDEKVVTGEKVLPGIPRRVLQEAIGRVTVVLDAVSLAHNDVGRGVEQFDQEQWQAQTLIELLEVGNDQLDAKKRVRA
jgi:hypothetical protein